MDITYRIAFRYIFTKKSFHFITIITTISILGITVGVAALICVMSVFNGFQQLTESQLIGFDPHIRIIPRNGAYFQNADSILAIINRETKYSSATKVIEGRVVGITGSNLQVFNLMSMPEKELRKIQGISNSMILGKFSLISEKDNNGIIIGAGLADKLKALPGDTVSLMTPRMIERGILSLRQSAGVPMLINGIFQTNIKDYDQTYAFSDVHAGTRIFSLSENSTSSIDIRLNHPEEAFEIANKLKTILEDKFSILTWYSLNSELFNVMEFERLSAFVILSLIIIIAVFNVLASLSMTVVEKRRDIAALKAMGAKNNQIRNIFIIEGSAIGFISTFLGTILGLALCFGQISYKWFRIDTSKFIIDAIPVQISSSDVIIVCIVSLVLSIAATIYPSYRAARTSIVDTIRDE